MVHIEANKGLFAVALLCQKKFEILKKTVKRAGPCQCSPQADRGSTLSCAVSPRLLKALKNVLSKCAYHVNVIHIISTSRQVIFYWETPFSSVL